MKRGVSAGKRRLRKASRSLGPALKALEAGSSDALATEFQQLAEQGLVKEQNECLHAGGRWSYTAVWGAHATVQAIEARETHRLRRFILKMIILSRQARGKHRTS